MQSGNFLSKLATSSKTLTFKREKQVNTLQKRAKNWTKSPTGLSLNSLQWSLASDTISTCNILVLFLISAKSGSMPSPPHSQGICVWFSSKGFLHLFFIHHSIRPRGLIVHHRHLIPATSEQSRHSSSSSLSARRWTSFISSWGNLQFGWRAQISTPCLFVKPLWRAYNVCQTIYTRWPARPLYIQGIKVSGWQLVRHPPPTYCALQVVYQGYVKCLRNGKLNSNKLRIFNTAINYDWQ